jgi:site-specific DNA recombinase
VHKGASFPGLHPAIIERPLWDHVQQQFKANLQAEGKRPRATSKSLLLGLLYDEANNRFTPSHATKKGRRYRYYVSQAVIKGTSKAKAGPTRIPAEEIEELVLSRLAALLQSAPRILDIWGTASFSVADAHTIAKVAKEYLTFPEKIRRDLPSIVTHIIVQQQKIELQLSKQSLLKCFLSHQQNNELDISVSSSGDFITLETDAQLRRCGGEVRLVLADSSQSKARSVPSLVRAVARAHDWMDRILRGEVSNQRALAKQTGFDERYISRIIPLAFLAPDITEAILEGRQAPDLSLDKCAGEIPLEWSLQRQALAARR